LIVKVSSSANLVVFPLSTSILPIEGITGRQRIAVVKDPENTNGE
jgi:hypothetical protein